MDTIILSLLGFCILLNIFTFIFLYKKIKKNDDFLQETMKDQVEAFTKIISYLDKAFANNLNSLEAMQQFNEKCAEKDIERWNKIANEFTVMQNFLSKLANGLGFKLVSNLEDLDGG